MRRWLAWLLALVPALVGLGLAVLLQSGRWGELLVGITVDLGTVLLLAGLLVSAVALGFVAVSMAAQHGSSERWRMSATRLRRPIAASCSGWITNSRIRSLPCGSGWRICATRR